MARPDRSFKRWAAAAKAAQQPPPAILLIHSVDDEYIPFSHAQQIAAQAQACHIPIETYFVRHATHGGAYGSDPAQYVARLKHFLAQQTGILPSSREKPLASTELANVRPFPARKVEHRRETLESTSQTSIQWRKSAGDGTPFLVIEAISKKSI